MKYTAFLYPLLAAALIACGGSDDIEPTTDPTPQLVKMSFLVNADATRTVLQSDYAVWFSNGDEIAIFDDEGDNHRFTTSLTEDAASAVFQGMAHKDAAADFYALYPYQEDAGMIFFGSTPGIIATLPTQQTAVRGSFDPKANISVSHLHMDDTSSDMPSFRLYNAGSLAQFTVPEGLSLQSVKITGNCPLSGDMGIVMPNDLTQITTTSQNIGDAAHTSNEVEIQATDGDPITAGTYYIALWPGTHSSITITLTSTDGRTKRGTLSNVTFRRSLVFDLGTF